MCRWARNIESVRTGFVQCTNHAGSALGAAHFPYRCVHRVFYLAPHGTINTPCPTAPLSPAKYSSADYGAIGSVSYFFNRYVGGQVEFARILTEVTMVPTRTPAGIIVRYPTDQGITPFVHALAGASKWAARTMSPSLHMYTWGPALTVGGGLDYNPPWFNHHLGMRLFQADYEYSHADFGPQPVYRRPRQYQRRAAEHRILSQVRQHHSAPARDLLPARSTRLRSSRATRSRSLAPRRTSTQEDRDLHLDWQGVTVTGRYHHWHGRYHWPAARQLHGHGPRDRRAEARPVRRLHRQLHGEAVTSRRQSAARRIRPPSSRVTPRPSPRRRQPAEPSADLQLLGLLRQVSGTGNTATLTTTGAPAGTITVTCNVADDKGQTASATTTVNVEAPPPPPAPQDPDALLDNFDRDNKRPARVDNEAKACLDEVALNAAAASGCTLVLVGNAGRDATAEPAKGKTQACS